MIAGRRNSCVLSIAALLAACTIHPAGAATNLISDQLVDGLGHPYRTPDGSVATLDDLGLGLPPSGNTRPVKLVPWTLFAGEVSQMAHVGDQILIGRVTGRVVQYDLAGTRATQPVLEIGAAREAFSVLGPPSGQGLRGLAPHPQFETNGLLYTMHRELAAGGAATHGDLTAPYHYVLGEWNLHQVVDGQPAFRSVLRVGYTETDHAGGQIGFNPVAVPGDADYGLLYAGFGDGGGACSGSTTCLDQFGYGQEMSTIQSAVIRINPVAEGASAYTIPSDNPFLAANDPGGLIPDEMYAKGFRNPSTMMFSQLDGRLFVGDISQNTVEEINLIESGHNYGWGLQEGTLLYTDLTNADDSARYLPLGDGSDTTLIEADFFGKNASGAAVSFLGINRLNDGFTSPVAQFSHEAAGGTRSAAVTGTVYSGSLASALDGLFLFGNLSRDELYFSHAADLVNDERPAQVYELTQLFDLRGVRVRLGDLVASERANYRFGQDGQGELYLMSKANRMIYRFEDLDPGELAGDLDHSAVVDGADFLRGQRGDWSAESLALWEENLGVSIVVGTPVQVVPEPGAASLGLIVAWVGLGRSRRGRGSLRERSLRERSLRERSLRERSLRERSLREREVITLSSFARRSGGDSAITRGAPASRCDSANDCFPQAKRSRAQHSRAQHSFPFPLPQSTHRQHVPRRVTDPLLGDCHDRLGNPLRGRQIRRGGGSVLARARPSQFVDVGAQGCQSDRPQPG
jgi:hypothetical protein